ncbi:PqiC family protein [Nitratifractor sp.]|uniref:PqiC family protein n=1 Tax=Nitratifractor sp. TaxID=2268144 RepID=UPI0025FC5B2B|nr:PqiC family protein [Nitratifractor sp.]
MYNSRALLSATTLAVIFLAGCSGKSDYYTLQPRLLPRHELRSIKTDHIVGIGEVQVADYLDKKELATRLGHSRMQIRQNSLWAGALNRNIQRVLKVNLSQLIPSRTFLAYPWEEPVSDSHRLFVTVDQFDGDSNGTVTLMGHWSLVDQRENRLVTGEDFRLTERGAPDTAGIVQTQNRLLERLSRIIAGKIRNRI